MKVGDMISVQSAVPDERTQAMKAVMRKARVVYVHPKQRFYVVEFSSGVRESFFFEHPVGESRFKSCPREGASIGRRLKMMMASVVSSHSPARGHL